VIVIASQLLAAAKSSLAFCRVISLGAPIELGWGKPAMTHIGKLFNVFSFGDLVQPYGNACSRVFPDQERVYNIACTFRYGCPTHSGLHSPLIARHLSKFSKYFKESCPYRLHIVLDGTCSVIAESKQMREKQLCQDRLAVAKIMDCLGESRSWHESAVFTQATP
jgi:hypothetical protein